MSDFFAQVERELCAATARRAHLPWYRRGTRVYPLRRARVALAALALVGASAAVALAASGVILTGSPVRTLERPSAIAGEGVPVAGGSRLLSLRAPDPAGGLPWGMRIVHTTRGLICVQVGRVDDGQLGELGVDGAFHDDGLFHPLPADALPDVLGVSDRFGSDCELPGATFAGDVVGLELSAANAPRPGVGPAGDRREISFGLLGRHAVSITYRSGSKTLTQPVIPGLGAYLIVQRYTGGRPLGSSSETDGSDLRFGFPASPNGALTSITYRFGKVCTDTGSGAMARSCGRSESPPPHAPPLPVVHTALHAHLQVRAHRITGAEISFAAPYPVAGAGEAYDLSARTCFGLTGGRSDRDLARGELVSIPIVDLLSLACSRTITFEVDYTRMVYGLPTPTPIGTVIVHEPPGTHPPPPPLLRSTRRRRAEARSRARGRNPR